MGWMEQAHCKDRTDIEFFPELGSNGTQAKKFCRPCPVKSECLQYAIDNNLNDGVWGGMSAIERRTLKRKARLRCT